MTDCGAPRHDGQDEPTPTERLLAIEKRLEDMEILLEDANILSSLVELTFGMVQVKMALERIEKKFGTAP